jgi:hypothetical protein
MSNKLYIYAVRQFTAIFLGFLILLGSLMPQTNFEELAKLPDLIAHFQVHQMKDESISFLSFINRHYSSSHRNEEDHSKLPLQKHCSCVFQALLNTQFTQVHAPEWIDVEFVESLQNPVLTFWTGSDYRHNLLKPPKA